MDNKLVILYTMKGCPHCVVFKQMLKDNGIHFYDRDIDEYSDEFDIFVELTGKDYVPSFMLVDESESDEPIPMLFAPEVDFNELEEGLEIIKKFLM
jgi:glutaredoxin